MTPYAVRVPRSRRQDRSTSPHLPTTREAAPSPAVQILELLLTQGPVAAAARDLLARHWLETAAAANRVVPPRLLPALLELGTTRPAAVRRAIAAAVGERGAWLAARNPEWRWLATPDDVRETSSEALAEVLTLRRSDPSAGRALVEETWETDGAQARAAGVALLAEGLGPDDEALLERCLDDRAKSVREEAARLLDRLPGSARAARMADRLRPLLTVTGTLRKRLEVGLPDDPDASGVRDGLVEPPRNVSRRAFWLRQIVAGAPLSVWTDAVRGDPRKVLAIARRRRRARRARPDQRRGRRPGRPRLGAGPPRDHLRLPAGGPPAARRTRPAAGRAVAA